MGKTYKRVPFDIELAKKIQSGEVEGRIMYYGLYGYDEVVILSYNSDKYDKYYPIRFAYVDTDEIDYLHDTSSLNIELPEEAPKTQDELCEEAWIEDQKHEPYIKQLLKLKEYTDQLMEVNQGVIDDLNNLVQDLKRICESSDQKHEFKPFDKVLVRENDEDYWHPDFFAMWHGEFAECVGYNGGKYIIPYEGNEHLLGTTNNPK